MNTSSFQQFHTLYSLLFSFLKVCQYTFLPHTLFIFMIFFLSLTFVRAGFPVFPSHTFPYFLSLLPFFIYLPYTYFLPLFPFTVAWRDCHSPSPSPYTFFANPHASRSRPLFQLSYTSNWWMQRDKELYHRILSFCRGKVNQKQKIYLYLNTTISPCSASQEKLLNICRNWQHLSDLLTNEKSTWVSTKRACSLCRSEECV